MKRLVKWIGSSALMLASVFMLSSLLSCGGNGKTPDKNKDQKKAEMFEVKFAASPADKGKVTAKVDGKDIKSGDKVEKNKEVVFTLSVTDEKKYEYSKWEGEGLTNTTATGAKLKVTKKADIKAVLKDKSNGGGGGGDVTEGKTVTFKVVDEKGADVPATKASISATKQAKDATSPTNLTSGDKVAKDTELVFTLKIDDTTYMLDKWEGATKDAANELVAKVTMDATDINVVAKIKPNTATGDGHTVTFKVVDEKGADVPVAKASISATKQAKDATSPTNLTSGDKVAKDTELVFTLKIDDTTYMLDKWEGATKDAANELVAKVTMDATDINVVAKLKKNSTDPAKQVTFKVVDESGAEVPVTTASIKATKKVGETSPVAFNSGADVEKDAELVFMLKIEDGEVWEVQEWMNAEKDANLATRATAKKGESNLNVIAKIKKIYAELKDGLKLVKKDTPNDVLMTFTAEALKLATSENGYAFDIFGDKTVRFDNVVAIPSDATITYSDDKVKVDGAGLELKKKNPIAPEEITIKVKKEGSPSYKERTYKFAITVKDKQECKATSIKLGDVYTLDEDDIEKVAKVENEISDYDSAGFEYVFEKDKSKIKIEATADPSDATVTIKKMEKKTNGGTDTWEEKDLTNNELDLTETEQFVKITIEKADCEKVTYVLRLRKAKETKEKYELKSLKVGEESLNANALCNLALNGYVIEFDTTPPAEIVWELQDTDAKVEVQMKKQGEQELKKVEDSQIQNNKFMLPALTRKEGNPEKDVDNYPLEIEITVTKDSNSTTYKLQIQKK